MPYGRGIERAPVVNGRRLDRFPSRDERRARFPVRALASVADRPLITKTWPMATRLDQGKDGACVGFGFASECNAAPVRIGSHVVTYDFALGWYHRAQQLDPWAGEDYDGTSVDAGAKVGREFGYWTGWHWVLPGEPVEDVMRAVAYEGPGCAGTWWLDGMFEPRPSGLLEVTGGKAGGHNWLIRGVVLKPRLKGETGLGPCLLMTNTWWDGTSPDVWGLNGSAYIRAEDFERLLNDDGEFCEPVGRADPHLRAPFG